MNLLVSRLIRLVACFGLVLLGPWAHAAGFQRGLAADPDGQPLEIGIWYPSATPPSSVSMGPTTMNVAVNAPPQGNNLPLVVISHGNGGFFLSHFDTAIALADAGFVVAAVTHTGDNFADQSRSMYVMDRSRHISRVLDHLLATWTGRALVDASRIGMFGFSSGGFTALVSIGGVPDFASFAAVCAQYPNDYACQLIAKNGGKVPERASSATGGGADARIKAAVVVAPALGFTFSPDGLKSVKVPVQLWRRKKTPWCRTRAMQEAVRLALPAGAGLPGVVPKAGHYDFLAPCSNAFAAVAAPICTSAAGFDRAAFHQGFNAAVAGFLARTLPATQKS